MYAKNPNGWLSSKPPAWFVVVCWFYPFLYWVFGVLLFMIMPKSFGVLFMSNLYLLCFPIPPVMMLFYSSWYRKMALIIWPVSFLVLGTSFCISQGALSAAISKAFSAVVSQTKNMQ